MRSRHTLLASLEDAPLAQAAVRLALGLVLGLALAVAALFVLVFHQHEDHAGHQRRAA